jgi:hypothetical protein
MATTISEILLSQIQQEARSNQDPLSLYSIFSIAQFPFLKTFSPHPETEEVNNHVKKISIDQGIWLEQGGDVYNSMTTFLHPEASIDPKRLKIIGRFYALLFFIDDLIGNEKLANRSEQEQLGVLELKKRLAKFIFTGQISPIIEPIATGTNLSTQLEAIESATYNIWTEITREIDKTHAPEAQMWLIRLKKSLADHLGEAMKNQNDIDSIQTVDQYIKVRREVSGMALTANLMEFGSNNFLDRQTLENVGLTEDIAILEKCCIDYGGLVNDFFSFWKEVIEDCTTFNLLAYAYLEAMVLEKNTTLQAVIIEQGEQMAAIIDQFDQTEFRISICLNDLLQKGCITHQLASHVKQHIINLRNGIAATWHWQMGPGNPRYQREHNIFTEVELPSVV